MKLEVFPHHLTSESTRRVSKLIDQFIGTKYKIVKTDVITIGDMAYAYVWYKKRAMRF